MKKLRSEAYNLGFLNIDFINDIRIRKDIENTNPSWLENDFYDNQWVIRSNQDGIRRFDWHRLLPNGLFLTSNGLEPKASDSRILNDNATPRNPSYQAKNDLRIQLNRLKKIVLLFRHPRVSRTCSFLHHYQFFCWILDFTEWAFLNEDIFQTRIQLFSLIDSKDIEDGFLLPLARGGKAELLNYMSCFINALKGIVDNLNKTEDKEQYFRLCKLKGIPYDLSSSFDAKLPFSHKEIALLKAWLYCNGYQIPVGGYKGKFSAEVFFAKEASLDVKADSLPDAFQAIFRALSSISNPGILEFSPSNVKEYLPAGEKTLRERLEQDEQPYNERIIDECNVMLLKLGRITRHMTDGLPPISTLSNVSLDSLHQLDLAPKGHTKTIPANVAMHALGHAVRFIINYGDSLVDYAIRVRCELKRLREADSALGYNQQCITYYSEKILQNIPVPESLSPLNITQIISVFESRGYPRFNKVGGNGKAEFLRNGMGITDALTLLLASTIIIIGTTAARRQIEIKGLPEDCLETVVGTGWYLRFKLGKNLFGAVQGELSRCIPNIAARAILQIKKLNNAWRELDKKSSTDLFFGFVTTFDKCTKLSQGTFNRILDVFSDFIEIPLDSDGKRWYLRAHQLRRFWAYTFFYKFGLSDLCTIGWYLGHIDAEQTWIYILESFDGHDKELVRIKAAYAADVLYSNTQLDVETESSVNLIKTIVKKHFGRKDFSLVEEDDLRAYLEILISDGNLDISPRFFTDENGKDYKLIWLINEK